MDKGVCVIQQERRDGFQGICWRVFFTHTQLPSKLVNPAGVLIRNRTIFSGERRKRGKSWKRRRDIERSLLRAQ